MHTGLAPTKTPVCHLWYWWGRSSTYLLTISISFHIPWWAVANPRTTMSVSCTVGAIWDCGFRFSCLLISIWTYSTGYGDGTSVNLSGICKGQLPAFLGFQRLGHHGWYFWWWTSPILLTSEINGVFFARPMHSTSKLDKTVLSKCVRVCVLCLRKIHLRTCLHKERERVKCTFILLVFVQKQLNKWPKNIVTHAAYLHAYNH